jgi:hypothetical protein
MTANRELLSIAIQQVSGLLDFFRRRLPRNHCAYADPDAEEQQPGQGDCDEAGELTGVDFLYQGL